MNHSVHTNFFLNDTSRLSNLDIPVNLQPMSTQQQIFRWTIIAVGFILNCILLIVLLGSRQLRYPRHLFWVAIGFINQFYLIQCMIEIIAIVYNDEIACQMFVLNAGVGYSLLLVCLSLYALDRYLAVAHHEWYKEKVTNRVVLIAISGALTVSYIGITSPFWTGFKKINTCTINLTHVHWVLAWNLLLGIFCLSLHIKIYLESRSMIRQYPKINHTPYIVHFLRNNPNEKDATPVINCGNSLSSIRFMQIVILFKI